MRASMAARGYRITEAVKYIQRGVCFFGNFQVLIKTRVMVYNNFMVNQFTKRGCFSCLEVPANICHLMKQTSFFLLV